MKYLNITRALIQTVTAALAVLCLSAAFTGQAHADTIGLHTVSLHGRPYYERTHQGGENTQHAFNNNNFGAYYIADSGLTFGAYRNSYWHTTTYLAWTLETRAYGPFSLSAAVGFATGYKTLHGVGVLRPMILPSLVTDLGFIRARYSVAPGKHGVFQHLSLEYKL
jgi:hypothetical protein